jgi:2-polyprenyl-3-methyl-5-hydroxy-6-metoxy-1,4-benzoquinol methylase
MPDKRCPLCDTLETQFERQLHGLPLVRCGGCGFVFTGVHEELITNKNSRYDDASVELYEERQNTLVQLWFERIARDLTAKLGPGRVLDVGCGTGSLLRVFHTFGWESWGIDLSPWSLRFAEKYGFELVQGTLEERGPSLGKFDLVVSTSTLEHIPAPRPHVDAIAGVLRPGGLAYFAGIPNYASASIQLGVGTFFGNIPPEHANFFTPTTLRRLLRNASPAFAKVRVRTYGIPETRWLLARIRRSLFKRATREKAPAPARQAPAETPQDNAGLKRTLGRLMLGATYHVGRVGGAGDKLEAIAIR